jgi:hypothetical protein
MIGAWDCVWVAEIQCNAPLRIFVLRSICVINWDRNTMIFKHVNKIVLLPLSVILAPLVLTLSVLLEKSIA